MKLVQAIIKPENLTRVTDALSLDQLQRLTVSEARGFTREDSANSSDFEGFELKPKVRLELACQEREVDGIVKLIQSASRAEGNGGGRIFVLAIEAATGMRNEERAETVLESSKL